MYMKKVNLQILVMFMLQLVIKEIFDEVIKNKGKSIITKKDHLTGTDRIFEAFTKLNLNDVDYVINLTRR